MYADRHQRTKPNPVSLTAAIGINAVLVAALLFSSPEIAEQFDTPFVGYDVPEPVVPPPEPPKPDETKPAESAARDTMVVVPIPTVPTASDLPLETTTIPQPLPPIALPPPPEPGLGATIVPPTPAPVLVDAAPVRGVDFQPEYPPSERRDGTEGNVTVRVLIGTDGRVRTVEKIRAASDAFFQATRRQALARWRFTPATRDGVPYDSWRTMTVRFVLEG